jgi:tRNA threonylcarbamoyladenosine biosynthesis protein TsaB
MIILTIRTDKPEAEIGLYKDNQRLAYETWTAHRELAETIHVQIAKILQFASKKWNDVEGTVVYKGPGSFTGLRIGLSVANALAYGLNVPIMAEGENWIETGISRLLKGDADALALPEYGAPVHITKPKK